MEFTIEDGKLYMLQTRNGKRTAQAALKIACDLVDEGVISQREAVLRVEPKQLDTLLHPQFDAAALKAAAPVGTGLAASPGSACGKVVFSAEDAAAWHKRGEKVVLVRLETSPEDIVGMQVSQGILTVRGGMTSHAAVVARGMGVCCVCGCGNSSNVTIDADKKTLTINGAAFQEGDPHLSGRLHRKHLQGQHPHRRRQRKRQPEALYGLGRRLPPTPGIRQRGYPQGRPAGPGLRRRGGGPVPHGAYVLRQGPHTRCPGDDRGRQPLRPGEGPWKAAALSAGRL
jgi:phosphohistidine swiveling domain-containing protein